MAERARAFAAAHFSDVTLNFHPQCFLQDGHFAGKDEARLAALREAMADEEAGAVWFARGGYGSNRIAEAAIEDVPAAAHGKIYMGYSDAGFLLAAFDKVGLHVAHGPMISDIVRPDGDKALGRALAWLTRRDPGSLEGGLQPGGRALAFNLVILSHLMGTAIEPDFTDADLLLEEVGEHDYRTDRHMFHISANATLRKVRQIRLGRFSHIPDNEIDFGSGPDEIIPAWCARTGIPFGGPADIGHDAANKVVPFRLGAE